MKLKTEGMTLLIAMTICLLVLGLSFQILRSVTKSVDRNSNIERSTQMFYAAESGLEAALLHQNIRGGGLFFEPVDENDPLMTLHHSVINAKSLWAVQGRFSDAELSTLPDFWAKNILLREYGRIEVPLFWNAADTPQEDPTDIEGVDFMNNENVAVVFDLADEDGQRFVPNNFDFGVNEEGRDRDNICILRGGDGCPPEDGHYNQVVVDWGVTRIFTPDGESSRRETFVPHTNLSAIGSCESAESELICEDDFLDGAQTNIVLSSQDNGINTITGSLQPCRNNCDLTLYEFFHPSGGDTAEHFMITFQDLVPLENSFDNTQLAGLPYRIFRYEGTVNIPDDFDLQNGGINDPRPLPQPVQLVTSDVEMGDYKTTFQFLVDDRAASGAFDYILVR